MGVRFAYGCAASRRESESDDMSKIELSAADFLPVERNLKSLRQAATQCEGCDLFLNGTHVVFGEGARRAALMLVGETPGDREEVAGKPFVGPAGKLLDQVLDEVGLSREHV